MRPETRLAVTSTLMRTVTSAMLTFSTVAIAAPPALMAGIDTVVIIYAENHSFDNMYGLFPGANGIARATEAQKTQLDHDGRPLRELVVFGSDGKPDPKYPRMPNGPFRIDAPPVDRPPTSLVPSPIHAFYHHQAQINGGRNNMFVANSTVGGWVMGYYDGSQFEMWKWAQRYTLADNFFQAAFGGSFLNHQWLICACTPRFEDAPEGMRPKLDAQGRLVLNDQSPSANSGAMRPLYAPEGGQVTPDGWAVNTTQPPYQPSGIPPAPDGDPRLVDPAGTRQRGKAVPPQTARTIGDALTARGVDWAWFAGSYDAALADGMQNPAIKRSVIYVRDPGSPMFQPHHQPFNYFANYAPGTAARQAHLKDGQAFLEAIDRGSLPAVSFYKPTGRETQHPSYTDIMTGDRHIADILSRLEKSPQWNRMLVIVTYDENGGYWDHVPPPAGDGWGDRWGPGSRIPAIFVGPRVRRGHIDSTPYDTTSILKFLTIRFELEPLPGIRRNVGDLTGMLQSAP